MDFNIEKYKKESGVYWIPKEDLEKILNIKIESIGSGYDEKKNKKYLVLSIPKRVTEV